MICQECKNEYKPVTSTQRYCCEKCSRRSKKRREIDRKNPRILITCCICGKTVERRKKAGGGRQSKTCGAADCVKENHKIALRNNATIHREKGYYKPGGRYYWIMREVCPVCGAAKTKTARNCGACRKKASNAAQREAELKEMACIVCGKMGMQKRNVRTCSPECRDAHRRAMDIKKAKRKRATTAGKLRANVSGQVRAAIKRGFIRGKKTLSTFAHLGYTPQELKAHLQNQFEFGMSWKNYGSEWQVDHIEPVALMAERGATIKKVWSLKNLKPRWATNAIANRYGGLMEGNAEKGARYVG